MPRRSKNSNLEDKTHEKQNKKTLMNTIVKDITAVENEDIILQLPITDLQINQINNTTFTDNFLPEPYEPNCYYINDNNIFGNIQDNNIMNDTFAHNDVNNSTLKSTNNCYWCCHPIENRIFGMPYKYNTTTDTYILYGSFCSLHCANAYNFSVHCGSDKVWEINSLIQMLSKHYGYIQPIRPAPSRFLLKIFNGPLSIEEFRKSHFSNDKTHLLNLPPMISMTFNYEVLNTSYLKNITDNMNIMKPSTQTSQLNSNSSGTKKPSKAVLNTKLNVLISD
jgi:hypothetical protein